MGTLLVPQQLAPLTSKPSVTRTTKSVTLLLVFMVDAALAAEAPEVRIESPKVTEAVPARVFEGTLAKLPRVRAYTKSTRVQVIEDLREDAGGGDKAPAPAPSAAVTPSVREGSLKNLARANEYQPGQPVQVMQDLKTDQGSATPGSAMPAPAASSFQLNASFDGIPATGYLPPDVAGAVGPSHYVLMINVAFAIYDKQGNTLVGPSPINALWAPLGGPCAAQNSGDPIVRYDHLADRWMMSQFALPPGANPLRHQCIAISRTPDPVAGGWYLYDFPMIDSATGAHVFPDYPKISVWPDGYYMGTQRSFPSAGLDVWSFEREKMLVGAPARMVQFAVHGYSLVLLPADLDGSPPPTGTPEFFARQVDGARFGGADRLEIFLFHVNWSSPPASTFGLASSLPTAPFNTTLCQGGFSLMENCIPQPGTPVKLEALSVWTMWRLQYRNFGSYETLLTNHTVNTGAGQAGIRWYELRRPPLGGWSIFQQGTHSPDNATSRWMGSVAMNKAGAIALGYSASGTGVYPSIRYAARQATDAPGLLGAEVNLAAGGGIQTFPAPRWGNYTTMDVDPVDDCTFWYAGEYMPSTSPAGWATRISSIKDSSCGAKITYAYAAKVLCAAAKAKDHEEERSESGGLTTIINIHNPSPRVATFSKELAVAIPPGDQKPGKVLPMGKDALKPGEALAVDCQHLKRRLFPSGLPAPLLDGFLAIRSDESLDVTAVYMSGEGSRGEGHRSVDVEHVSERTVTH